MQSAWANRYLMVNYYTFLPSTKSFCKPRDRLSFNYIIH